MTPIFFVRALGTLDEVLSVTCIPNNEEKYISFSLKFELKKERKEVAEGKWKEFVVKHEIRFLDSFQIHAGRAVFLSWKISPKKKLKENCKIFWRSQRLGDEKGSLSL